MSYLHNYFSLLQYFNYYRPLETQPPARIDLESLPHASDDRYCVDIPPYLHYGRGLGLSNFYKLITPSNATRPSVAI